MNDETTISKTYEYRIVRSGDVRYFHSRNCLPVELKFVRYINDGWVRLFSPGDNYEIDVEFNAIINLMPEFSPRHRHIILSYSERRNYPIHVLIPKTPTVSQSQEIIYRHPPQEKLQESTYHSIDSEELRDQTVEPEFRSGWEETWDPLPF
jgi:hypothetical protein